MMREPSYLDYLVIGHVAQDITADKPTLGGTASFASRTALAMGYRTGVITSCKENLDLSELDGIQLLRYPAQETSTFKNIYSYQRRVQKILARASNLDVNSIPGKWRSVRIAHLGPIAREIDPNLLNHFSHTFLGITPQGWLRHWDSSGHISLSPWETIKGLLARADAVVLSLEDLSFDEKVIPELSQHCNVLAITRAAQGISIYWESDRLDIPGLKVEEVDPTGAGDIFAAIFFILLYETGDPIESGRLANHVAATSVTRTGIQSTPKANELQQARNKVTP
jgi:hypothetical protein